MLKNLYTDVKILTMVHSFVLKLCDFKVLKIGQNLHANMEGFRRASHIYAIDPYFILILIFYYYSVTSNTDNYYCDHHYSYIVSSSHKLLLFYSFCSIR